ncbi:MAG: type II toxin-antitoxin system prevent-host-death family antitoxin [Thermoflexus sp.]|jgi:prevent-host-death family protein|uniref:type II toxin-antitoxin system Phd/YefM family antitoxin n=1 Tax=Thermoflexus TaxID=1495649 RepID=UPI001C7617B5|nr:MULTISPECIES: type II toxin-antitoxin system prevent-host-death family antitoxin [Thermoflexus]MDT7884685.1 type II toxin-antitoxin system prevent-host-death family antitoxin [Thermoflexus sp.]MDT7948498.1 type II toxin-antitoxin system prevent-host-death family antitoxin [Thermoflexus sp.]QWK10250.1 MAG: type II toxin-antitoxin system prevent-host-death family antitoxin [Thermoflexus hugenholtzii]
MPCVSVRELKEQLSRILRDVREGGEEYLVTYRGRVVARISPVVPPERRVGMKKVRKVLRDLDRLAAEIGKKWPTGVSAVEAVRGERRDF